MSNIKKLLNKIEPMIQKQAQLLDDKDNLAKNQLSQENTAVFLKSLTLFDETLATLEDKINDVQTIPDYLFLY